MSANYIAAFVIWMAPFVVFFAISLYFLLRDLERVIEFDIKKQQEELTQQYSDFSSQL